MENHLRILADLRWQIFRNSLRTERRKWEFAAQIALWVIGVVIAVGLGIGLGATAYLSLSWGRTAAVAGALWAIFVFWQTGPLVLEGSSPALDFREIARYPVSFRLYYLLNTAYGLLDPVAVQCLIWLACVWTGIAAARLEWAARTALVFAIFAVFNLFLGRVIFGFFDRIMRTRRGRERLIGVLLALVLLSQFVIYAVLPRVGRAIAPKLLLLNRISPPGMSAQIVISPWSVESASLLLVLAGGTVLLALVLRRQLRRLYRGDVVSETAAPSGSVQVEPGWKLPGLSDSTSAMVEKEVRYATRDGRTLLACASAPLAALIVLLSADFVQKGLRQSLHMDTSGLYLIMVGYALINLVQLVYNCLSYESHGFYLWLLTLPDLRKLLKVKNAVFAGLLFVDFVLVTLLISRMPGFSWQRVPMVVLGLAFAGIATLAVGNLFSVWFPTRIEYGTLSAKKASEVAILLGFVSQLVVLGLVGLVFYTARRFSLEWLPPAAFALLITIAAKCYLISLDRASQYVRLRADKVLAALV